MLRPQSRTRSSWVGRGSPQTEVIITRKIVMQLDPVLERLHCRMRQAQRRVVFLAELRAVIDGGRRACRSGRHLLLRGTTN